MKKQFFYILLIKKITTYIINYYPIQSQSLLIYIFIVKSYFLHIWIY